MVLAMIDSSECDDGDHSRDRNETKNVVRELPLD